MQGSSCTRDPEGEAQYFHLAELVNIAYHSAM